MIERIIKEIHNDPVKRNVYNLLCSQVKVILNPTRWSDLALSNASMTQLRTTDRITTNKIRITTGHRHLVPCKISKRVLGDVTYAMIQSDCAIRAKRTHYAGNWVIARRGSRYDVILGFFDCSLSSSNVEAMVKHSHLCRVMNPEDTYFMSGTFVVGLDDINDQAFSVIVNMRSGSWALAKMYLRAIGKLDATAYPDEVVDADAASFATPRVLKVLSETLRAVRRQ